MFSLTIETETAPFSNGNREREIVRILREAANRIESGGMPSHHRAVRDSNSNIVGHYEHIED